MTSSVADIETERGGKLSFAEQRVRWRMLATSRPDLWMSFEHGFARVAQAEIPERWHAMLPVLGVSDMTKDDQHRIASLNRFMHAVEASRSGDDGPGKAMLHDHAQRFGREDAKIAAKELRAFINSPHPVRFEREIELEKDEFELG